MRYKVSPADIDAIFQGIDIGEEIRKMYFLCFFFI